MLRVGAQLAMLWVSRRRAPRLGSQLGRGNYQVQRSANSLKHIAPRWGPAAARHPEVPKILSALQVFASG